MLKSFPVPGKKFAELRERYGFTQDSLARATGRSKGTFANYEGKETATIAPAILDDVAVAFGTTRDRLLVELGWESLGSTEPAVVRPVVMTADHVRWFIAQSPQAQHDIRQQLHSDEFEKFVNHVVELWNDRHPKARWTKAKPAPPPAAPAKPLPKRKTA